MIKKTFRVGSVSVCGWSQHEHLKGTETIYLFGWPIYSREVYLGPVEEHWRVRGQVPKDQ